MTRHLMVLGGALVSVAAAAVAAQSPDLQKLARLRNPAALTEQAPAAFKANFATSAGAFVVEVHRDWAPIGADRFYNLVKNGFYDDIRFYRVIPKFMIQGGGPNSTDSKRTDTYGMGGPSEKLKAEFNDTPHRRGIVSMARTNDPNSAGSQFFIVVNDSNFLDRQYTVFGEVVKGMEVADKIVSLPRNARDLPNERVEITVSVE